jgi:hypothetical protein
MLGNSASSHGYIFLANLLLSLPYQDYVFINPWS